MTDRALENCTSAVGPGRYFERLTRALPGARSWSLSRGARDFWPDEAKLVISIFLQFEGSGDYEYGFHEGIPRLLEVFQRRRVKVTVHMMGTAVERNLELAREIVERGHEAAAHGPTWAPTSVMSREQERASYEASLQSILRSTGVQPVGLSGFWLRSRRHTVEIMQELGFLYHVNDASRDEPFLISTRGKPFVVVPHAPGKDILARESPFFSSDQYASELKNEFEMLYTEADNRRRMMSIGMHDRLAGRPAQAKVLEEFIIHAQRRPGVVFLRKDEIAHFAVASAITPRAEERWNGLEAA